MEHWKSKASLKAYSEDFSSLSIRSPSSGLLLNQIRCNKRQIRRWRGGDYEVAGFLGRDAAYICS
jgi:hypothetical protein